MEASDNGSIFEMKNAFDLYEKAVYDLKTFEKTPVPFHLFNLITSLSHIYDWIVNDAHFDEKIREAAKRFSESDEEYILVRKLCNRTKHFRKKQSDPKTYLFSSTLGQFKLGYSPLGNVHTFFVSHNDQNIDALDVCKSVLAKWKAILDNAKVLP